MSDLILYFIGLAVIVSSLLVRYYYKKRLNSVLQSFLNSHDNIMVLFHSNEVSMINRAGLKVFGYKSLDSFRLAHADISDFFIDNEKDNDLNSQDNIRYIDKYTYGKNWVEAVSKSKSGQVKVKMFSQKDMVDRYYQILISKLNCGKDYSLTFTDITELECNRLKSQHSAEYDPLTKIYNRVKINEVFENLAYNAKKYSQDLTLILFDIDHFKKINDTYGHQAGDSVLKELSSLVRGLLRDGDIFARWGGEEFVLLLQDTSLIESKKMALRLRHEIEKFHFNIIGKLSCSFGVTEFRAGDTEAIFFERVDMALYEAKDNGRNQVVVK